MQTTPALSTEKEETSPISVVAVNTTTDVTARTNSSTSADIGNEQVGAVSFDTFYILVFGKFVFKMCWFEKCYFRFYDNITRLIP